MSDNKDAHSLLNRKRDGKVDYVDNQHQDSRRQDHFLDSNLSINFRSSDIFADPNNTVMGHPYKKDHFQGPLSQVYNTASGLTPKYNLDSSLPMQDTSFFQSNKGIITPLSPAYTPGNNIAYYSLTNLQKNNSNINQTQNQGYINRTYATPNTNTKSESELSNTDMMSPHLQHLEITDLSAPKLQNIVSTVNLKCSLELRDIALKAKNAEYNPKRFAAVIMRIREPKTTALIFASGKMVCTGARSEEDSRKASRQYAKIIQKLGYQVKFAEFKIQNIVGSCDVRFPIRLEGLAASHSKFCSYEPEMFPGLIYKMAQPKIVLLIFVSGKIVLTGAKERGDIYSAYEKIYPVLLGFKKKDLIQMSVDDNGDHRTVSSACNESTSNYHRTKSSARVTTASTKA